MDFLAMVRLHFSGRRRIQTLIFFHTMQALSESLETDNFDYRNGTKLATLFFNRSFNVDDEDFYIDQFGQRQMKWWCSYFDNFTGSFVVGFT
jgi:hypothetical protein